MIKNSIIDCVGNTPIVRLKRLENKLNLSCNVFIKLESQNIGGSHKTRIALNMIFDAEKKGILTRGSNQVILEPTGGNTGVGICIAAAVLGYKVVLVIPDNYSKNKQNILRAYGAELILSDSSKGNNSHGDKAQELLLINPSWVMLNQQRNQANPMIHKKTTAKEILQDFSGDSLDFMVAGIGTGGHLTGVGEVLKKAWSNLNIFGVQPDTCDLFNDIHRPHSIQGLSVGLIPDVLNTDIIDDMISVSYEEAISMTKVLIREEGISSGLSTGANIAAILKIDKKVAKNANILTFAYDEIDSYLNEIVSS